MTPEEKRQAREGWLATWRKTFEELLGDAEPYLSRNVARWDDWMVGIHSDCGLFYHDTPLSYIVHELIPEDLDDDLSLKLLQELELAITPPGDYLGRFAPDLDPNYDWNAVRGRVAAVIAKYRNSLSKPR